MVVQLERGALIAGRYRLERLIGRGGMGQVWAASHEVTGKRSALKFVRAASEPSPQLLRRFSREARAASVIDHPGVIDVRDVFLLDGGTPVMVMELLEGEDLAQLLEREGKLELGDAADLLLQVVSVIGSAHEAGVVHRDLKPANIFLVDDDGSRRVKVLDFGVAKLAADPWAEGKPVTKTGQLLGTPAYMAPEQCRGEPVDHRTDMWAIGVMMYQVLSGKRPLQGDTVAEIVEQLVTSGVPPLRTLAPDAPLDVAVLARRLLQRDPDERPDDLREAADVLSKHAQISAKAFGAANPAPDTPAPTTGEPDDAEPDALAPVADATLGEETPRRSPLLWAGAIAAGLALIGALAISVSGDDAAAPAASSEASSDPSSEEAVDTPARADDKKQAAEDEPTTTPAASASASAVPPVSTSTKQRRTTRRRPAASALPSAQPAERPKDSELIRSLP